jgi:hypothetical protein
MALQLNAHRTVIVKIVAKLCLHSHPFTPGAVLHKILINEFVFKQPAKRAQELTFRKGQDGFK